ncbi:hypothetical protein H1C71_003178 [Ictidomys tridecemlineatus]|nr:hypothetical protein H1C71_003178 [Ictidomys tridecemlineatus]
MTKQGRGGVSTLLKSGGWLQAALSSRSRRGKRILTSQLLPPCLAKMEPVGVVKFWRESSRISSFSTISPVAQTGWTPSLSNSFLNTQEDRVHSTPTVRFRSCSWNLDKRSP